MDLDRIFTKSPKGMRVLRERKSELTPPMLQVLLAIDGRSSLSAIAARMGGAADDNFNSMLRSLEESGFIREWQKSPEPPKDLDFSFLLATGVVGTPDFAGKSSGAGDVSRGAADLVVELPLRTPRSAEF
jgi:hypothetical protein